MQKNTLLFAILFSFTFLSCKDDDPGLEGTWELIEFSFTIENRDGIVQSSGSGFNYTLALIFEGNSITRIGNFDLIYESETEFDIYRDIAILDEENTWRRDDQFLYVDDTEYELEYTGSTMTLIDEQIGDDMTQRTTIVLKRSRDKV